MYLFIITLHCLNFLRALIIFQMNVNSFFTQDYNPSSNYSCTLLPQINLSRGYLLNQINEIHLEALFEDEPTTSEKHGKTQKTSFEKLMNTIYVSVECEIEDEFDEFDSDYSSIFETMHDTIYDTIYEDAFEEAPQIPCDIRINSNITSRDFISVFNITLESTPWLLESAKRYIHSIFEKKAHPLNGIDYSEMDRQQTFLDNLKLLAQKIHVVEHPGGDCWVGTDPECSIAFQSLFDMRTGSERNFCYESDRANYGVTRVNFATHLLDLVDGVARSIAITTVFIPLLVIAELLHMIKGWCQGDPNWRHARLLRFP